MKNSKKIWLLVLGIMGVILISLIFLSTGKSLELKIETPSYGITTVHIIRGECIGCGYNLVYNQDATVDDISSTENTDIGYIQANIVNKGYSNEKVINLVKNYAQSRGGKLLSVTDNGYGFVGLNWMFR